MNILILGHFTYRDHSAASLRVSGMAAAFNAAGHNVRVIDHLDGAPADGEEWEIPTKGRHRLEGVSLDQYAEGIFSRAPRGFRGLFLGDVVAGWLMARNIRPDLVVIYGTHLCFVRRVERACARLHVPILLDVVEWYAAGDLPGGRLGPYALSNAISMGWASKRADGIIAISRRLEQHYLQAGLPVLRVPPMFEPAELVRKWSQDDGSLHLCYAGSPGRKEAFDVIVDGCNAAAAAGVSLVLHLIGITQNQWHSLAGPAAFDCDVRCYGRVPNEHAREIVGACDFSLVVRPFRRSNQYGFPSKCAESLSLGTPVIANLFSDLGEELTDGKDSLILKELSAEALTDRIVTASGMTPDCRKAMAGAARALGARRFSPQSHAERITRFLERLA